MKIALIGASGMVGRVILDLIKERNLLFEEIFLVASEASAGKKIKFLNKLHSFIAIEKAIEFDPDIAIFAAGREVSLKWAPIFAAKGTIVIDNSSAWRMDNTKKLIIPEINGSILTLKDNCKS